MEEDEEAADERREEAEGDGEEDAAGGGADEDVVGEEEELVGVGLGIGEAPHFGILILRECLEEILNAREREREWSE